MAEPYLVTLSLVEVRTFQVRADSPALAVLAAQKASPEKIAARWRPDTVAVVGKRKANVLGQCDSCELWLIEGTDEAACDDGGDLLCMPCATVCAEAKDEALLERGL